MEIDSTSDPQFFLKPATRSYHFLAGTILLSIDVVGGIAVLVRYLNQLPFGAAAGLVAGIILLVVWWRFMLRCHERLALVIGGREESLMGRPVNAALCASADLIKRGLFITSVMALMLLAALVQVLAGRLG